MPEKTEWNFKVLKNNAAFEWRLLKIRVWLRWAYLRIAVRDFLGAKKRSGRGGGGAV